MGMREYEIAECVSCGNPIQHGLMGNMYDVKIKDTAEQWV